MTPATGFDVDQEKVMHAAYEVFEKEASGMDHRMIDAFCTSLWSNLSAEAAANADSNRGAKSNHAWERALSGRAATSEKRPLEKEAIPVQRTPRMRKPSEMFVAGPTLLHGSRKGGPGRRPPSRGAEK